MGALRPGQMLDGTSYQVVREIGAGGMGVVYEIEHVRLKKRYVAKVIHDQIKNDDGAAKRMEREAQVLAAISHPNIVQVHDVGTTQDGVSYFVMEKLEGVDLRSTMRRGVTRLRSIEIITDVLDALEYVHRRGIVHRDIKPENVFLSEQPRGTVTKVLDFGIVHIFDKDGRVSQGRITKTGGFVGTLYYAAPEQMQGKPACPPNDVYAAGLVLFELLAGKGPFDDDPGVGLSRCFKPAPPLTELVPHAPQELSDVVAKALEQDPERRPSAGALAADLRAVAAALRSNPHVAEDEAIRAEVHDLLRHMPPVDDARPRPAAGRMATPARQPSEPVDQAERAPPRHDLMPRPDVVSGATAAPATAAPATPLMAGAPGRTPSEPRASFEATLASAQAPQGSNAESTAHAAVAQPGPAPTPHTPTLLGAGVEAAPQRQSSSGAAVAGAAAPNRPPTGPQPGAPGASASHASPASAASATTGPPPHEGPHRDSSDPIAGANGLMAHAVSATPPSPRFPPGTAHGVGPMMASAAPGPAASSGHMFASEPGQPPPLFATTIPVRPVHTESNPGAPARTGDTSPGLYATVDSQATAAPPPKRTPWTAITLAVGGLVLVALLVGGAFALRQKSSSTASTGPAPQTTTTASTSSSAGASPTTTSEPTASAVAATTSGAPGATRPVAAASARTDTSAPAAASSSPAAEARASAPHAPTAQPAARTTSASPTTKPAPPPRPSNTGRAAEKDGYVNTF